VSVFRYYAFDEAGKLIHSYEVQGDCHHDALQLAHVGYEGWPSPQIAQEFVIPLDSMGVAEEEPLEAA